MTAADLLNAIVAKLGHLQTVEDDFNAYETLKVMFHAFTSVQDELVRAPYDEHRDMLLQDEIRRLEAALAAEELAYRQIEATVKRQDTALKALQDQAKTYRGLYQKAEQELSDLQEKHNALLEKISGLTVEKDENGNYPEEDWDD